MSTNIHENTVADVNQNITINHFEFIFYLVIPFSYRFVELYELQLYKVSLKNANKT